MIEGPTEQSEAEAGALRWEMKCESTEQRLFNMSSNSFLGVKFSHSGLKGEHPDAAAPSCFSLSCTLKTREFGDRMQNLPSASHLMLQREHSCVQNLNSVNVGSRSDDLMTWEDPDTEVKFPPAASWSQASFAICVIFLVLPWQPATFKDKNCDGRGVL